VLYQLSYLVIIYVKDR